MLLKQDKKKYIELKDGYNKSLFLGLFVVAGIVGLLATSKMWLPDDRPILGGSSGYEVSMTNNKLTTSKMKIDKKDGLLELKLEEQATKYKKKYDFHFEVVDDKGASLPYQLIQDKMTPTSKGSPISKRHSIIQIGFPENLYYVKVIVSQPKLEKQELIFDYRTFKKADLTEKGVNYLLDQQAQKQAELALKDKEKDQEKTKEKQDENAPKNKDKTEEKTKQKTKDEPQSDTGAR